jgi:NAD(P)H-hydrate epimerase
VNWPSLSWSGALNASSAELRQADREARERFIEPIQLMEVAGWQIARVVEAVLGGVAGKSIIVVAGSGNNGGDALVAARFLHQRGAHVAASVVTPRDADSLVAQHARTIERLGIMIDEAPAGIGTTTDLIVDGLLGTGIRPPLRPPAPDIIRAMNASGRPIVAVDVPSGVDASTGEVEGAAVTATRTVTFHGAKVGLHVKRTPQPSAFPTASFAAKRPA